MGMDAKDRAATAPVGRESPEADVARSTPQIVELAENAQAARRQQRLLRQGVPFEVLSTIAEEMWDDEELAEDGRAALEELLGKVLPRRP